MARRPEHAPELALFVEAPDRAGLVNDLLAKDGRPKGLSGVVARPTCAYTPSASGFLGSISG
jgi:hypothetical protein